MSKPPQTMESAPPNSTRRANDVYTACGPLSSDGAAAVLQYARRMVDKETRRPANLQNIAIWSFTWVVEAAANELKEGIFSNELVFIASVYRLLHARGDASAMTLGAFKARVLEARHNRLMWLERCRKTTGISPLLLEASATKGERGTYHLIRRSPISNVKHALEHVTSLLPDSARPCVASFARRVHADEALRDGRPRLITLGPEAFAARVQQLVDREATDLPITKLFWKLEDLGEMTGIDLESFKARLLAAHRASCLRLGAAPETQDSATLFLHASTIQEGASTWSVVCRSNCPLPVPWGPPARPIARRLVLQAR
jgi:hypothetical protein